MGFSCFKGWGWVLGGGLVLLNFRLGFEGVVWLGFCGLTWGGVTQIVQLEVCGLVLVVIWVIPAFWGFSWVWRWVSAV